MTLALVEDSPSSRRPPSDDVALAAAGDRRAFERLYRSHVDRVYTICARMTGDRQQAEELTQDVFVRAWEKLALFRRESSFTTWMHRLAVNVVLNARRASRRRRARFTLDVEDASAVRAAGGSTAAHLGAPGDRLDIAAAIASLPEVARRAFVLHVDGYRHDEIGRMLHISVGGSKHAVHRARTLLRGALAERRPDRRPSVARDARLRSTPTARAS